MEITWRDLITALHGMGFGALFLLIDWTLRTKSFKNAI